MAKKQEVGIVHGISVIINTRFVALNSYNYAKNNLNKAALAIPASTVKNILLESKATAKEGRDAQK